MFKRKGGGSKAFWTMFKKTALFSYDGFPKSSSSPSRPSELVCSFSFKLVIPSCYSSAFTISCFESSQGIRTHIIRWFWSHVDWRQQLCSVTKLRPLNQWSSGTGQNLRKISFYKIKAYFSPNRNRILKLRWGSSRDYRNHHCELLQKRGKCANCATFGTVPDHLWTYHVWRIW